MGNRRAIVTTTYRLRTIEKTGRIEVVIRPEAIEVAEEGNFAERVNKSMFMGAHHEYEINFFGKPLEISLNNPKNKSMVATEETLKFSLDASSIHIL